MPEDARKRLEKAFKGMMKALFREEGASLRIELLEEPEVAGFIEEHAQVLDSSFAEVEMSDIMRARLRESDYIFSGIKTFHELNEAFPSLLDENGDRKPFNQFLNDVQAIDSTYNKAYLSAEYNHAQAAAEMAAKWEDYAEDGDEYNLQYRTAGDDKVRPEHAALHGVTLPMSDPFWDEYYPPNGWNCRCTVVQVLKDKYPATDRAEAFRRGQEALAKDTKGIFHYNPGKQGKAFPDYNPYTLSKCNTCTRKLNLSKDIAENELCEWCLACRHYTPGSNARYQENKQRYRELEGNPDYRYVQFDESTGGLKAEHSMHNQSGEGYKFELMAVEAGFNAGHCVILGPEPNNQYKQRSTEGGWDGHPFEVSGKLSFSKGSVRNGLKHCASKRVTEYAVLCFPNGGFDTGIFNEGLKMFNGLKEKEDGQWMQFKKIICVQDQKIVYELDL